MCGIVGFVSEDSNFDLNSSISMLKHRGPDDEGVFCDLESGVGLGHTRLSIQDTSPAGRQPMISNGVDKPIVITFNGEIYNFKKLKRELLAEGCSFSSDSDTEVLLNLYIKHGKDFLRLIDGIFAFAIWDGRSNELLVVRDAFGVKPIYYIESENFFAFASELKVLQAHGRFQSVDSKAVHQYLTFLWSPGEYTPAKSIKKIPPGEAFIVNRHGIVEKWNWHEDCKKDTMPRDFTNKKEVIHTTRKLLREAVHRQMVSDVPVGAFLSGGLDSSAVVAMARECNPDINCFTIKLLGNNDAGITDDLPYAKRVAKHLNVPLDIVEVDSANISENIEKMIYILDEPLADPAALNVLFISQLARENNIKVLLSGAGGDDIFTGYRRHAALSYEKFWAWMPRAIRRFLAVGSRIAGQSGGVIGRRLNKAFYNAESEPIDRLFGYFFWTEEPTLRGLYSEDLKKTLAGYRATTPFEEFLSPYLQDGVSNLQLMLALEQRFFLTDHNLNYTDKMSMAAGVEVRVPFLDRELVSFANSIPNKYKQRGTTGKWVLKKSMESILPHDVIYRPKTGFGAPLRHWIKFELKEMLEDYLSMSSIESRGLFNAASVRRLIRDNDAGKIDASYTIFSLLCIEIWCRHYVDHSNDLHNLHRKYL